ncbi:hypothetical protein [Glaciibacter psychrotolerans]|uniref:Uncharacterized protein n=1 Tax=Glaciibacter psychrotolerans TaxID=670054 RepID=A0A7Z0ECJ1_9MICO|nr:hypothetical protein [Leifsonia psychrotolerans]NYJ19158.1 hypothetical protein [Leifsonia psychrotolerans]
MTPHRKLRLTCTATATLAVAVLIITFTRPPAYDGTWLLFGILAFSALAIAVRVHTTNRKASSS